MPCLILTGQVGFQSTLPTRGSDDAVTYTPQTLTFSIHAPHEGERHGMIYNLSFIINFSIHAPHEGERLNDIH